MAEDRLNGEGEKRKDNAETQGTLRKRREECEGRSASEGGSYSAEEMAPIAGS